MYFIYFLENSVKYRYRRHRRGVSAETLTQSISLAESEDGNSDFSNISNILKSSISPVSAISPGGAISPAPGLE
jgi:hypothetical protein